MAKTCCQQAAETALQDAMNRLDDLRWEEHDKNCDERLGDGSQGVIAKCYEIIEKLLDEQ